MRSLLYALFTLSTKINRVHKSRLDDFPKTIHSVFRVLLVINSKTKATNGNEHDIEYPFINVR